MQQSIKNTLKRSELYPVLHSLKNCFADTQRCWKRQVACWKRQPLIDAYFANNTVKALQIGAGDNIREDFLNCDLDPAADGVIFMDAIKRFPFSDGSFDYVYSEHMIEHVKYAEGFQMLQECFRVLKPGGVLRIATPDLVFLIDLYTKEKTTLHKEYIDWSMQTLLTAPSYAEDTFVINHFVRAWHHEFIYDQKVMQKTLESIGFRDLVICALNESQHEKLRGLENEDRLPEHYLALVTMVFEASKPQ